MAKSLGKGKLVIQTSCTSLINVAKGFGEYIFEHGWYHRRLIKPHNTCLYLVSYLLLLFYALVVLRNIYIYIYIYIYTPTESEKNLPRFHLTGSYMYMVWISHWQETVTKYHWPRIYTILRSICALLLISSAFYLLLWSGWRLSLDGLVWGLYKVMLALDCVCKQIWQRLFVLVGIPNCVLYSLRKKISFILHVSTLLILWHSIWQRRFKC